MYMYIALGQPTYTHVQVVLHVCAKYWMEINDKWSGSRRKSKFLFLHCCQDLCDCVHKKSYWVNMQKHYWTLLQQHFAPIVWALLIVSSKWNKLEQFKHVLRNLDFQQTMYFEDMICCGFRQMSKTYLSLLCMSFINSSKRLQKYSGFSIIRTPIIRIRTFGRRLASPFFSVPEGKIRCGHWSFATG